MKSCTPKCFRKRQASRALAWEAWFRLPFSLSSYTESSTSSSSAFGADLLTSSA